MALVRRPALPAQAGGHHGTVLLSAAERAARSRTHACQPVHTDIHRARLPGSGDRSGAGRGGEPPVAGGRVRGRVAYVQHASLGESARSRRYRRMVAARALAATPRSPHERGRPVAASRVSPAVSLPRLAAVVLVRVTCLPAGLAHLHRLASLRGRRGRPRSVNRAILHRLRRALGVILRRIHLSRHARAAGVGLRRIHLARLPGRSVRYCDAFTWLTCAGRSARYCGAFTWLATPGRPVWDCDAFTWLTCAGRSARYCGAFTWLACAGRSARYCGAFIELACAGRSVRCCGAFIWFACSRAVRCGTAAHSSGCPERGDPYESAEDSAASAPYPHRARQQRRAH